MNNKIPHIKFKAILNNNNNEILFMNDVEHDNHKSMKLPEGMILYGEAPENALKRTILEYTDIEVEPLALLGIYSSMTLDAGNTIHSVTIVFICLILDLGKESNKSNCVWLYRDNHTKMPLNEEDNRILRDYTLWRVDKSTHWTSKLCD
ncbi:NUDIX domain-containing protein [Candidatus Nitrosocosmicus hydrocola]|uniref:NUDIX domain-containing protein n=1 Tax=Candidatus Nitrosocosmicus hydrocola TaxID=1826872 RepID=UPI0011E5DB42|nr:NUDIX domain-containing protein [Candidatus Nitrosocosmicus hydrocola]